MTDIIIRPALKKDRTKLFSLAARLSMSFTVSEPAFNKTYEILLHEQADNRAFILIAEEADEVIGCLLGYMHRAFYANGLIGWLEELYVLPEHRGKGTGKLLLSKFEETLLQNGAVLNALATRRANGFYLSCGYEESATSGKY